MVPVIVFLLWPCVRSAVSIVAREISSPGLKFFCGKPCCRSFRLAMVTAGAIAAHHLSNVTIIGESYFLDNRAEIYGGEMSRRYCFWRMNFSTHSTPYDARTDMRTSGGS